MNDRNGKRISCCRGCQDRHEKCHAFCEKYLQEKADFEAEKQRIRDIKKAQSDLDDYFILKGEKLKDIGQKERYKKHRRRRT